jgi:hypothetical protein
MRHGETFLGPARRKGRGQNISAQRLMAASGNYPRELTGRPRRGALRTARDPVVRAAFLRAERDNGQAFAISTPRCPVFFFME